VPDPLALDGQPVIGAPGAGRDGASPEEALPPELARVLDVFSRLGREQTMQALVDYANRFPELPDRFAALAAGEEHKVHECMTPVALFSEVDEGRIRFYADVPRNAPTIRALLSILMQGLNGRPPEDVLAIPSDFVSKLMRNVGLSTRERGLQAILARMKRHAREALAA
jgi:cysteine desulfuration protein SufE